MTPRFKRRIKRFGWQASLAVVIFGGVVATIREIGAAYERMIDKMLIVSANYQATIQLLIEQMQN